MFREFRKKPVVIQSMQWTNEEGQLEAIASRSGTRDVSATENGELTINTLEGDMVASLNDFIIIGVQGEMYPCKPDIFEATYDVVK